MHTDIRTTLNSSQELYSRGQIKEAHDLLVAATGGQPNNSCLWTALGVVERSCGKPDDAAESFLRALSIDPDRADAQVYLGMIRLSQGRQKEGWALYHARWRTRLWTERLRYSADSQWQGDISPGLRLLLWGEQGLGDVIQFARYAPWVLKKFKGQGADLVLEVPDELYRLFKCSWPFMNIQKKGSVKGTFDAHLPLMDLPLLYYGCGGEYGLPYQPYKQSYLSSLPDLLSVHRGWCPQIDGSVQDVIRVGIQWQGRHSHPDDKWRSISSDYLSNLFGVQGVRWINLQKTYDGYKYGLREDLESCDDFLETARVVGALDLVISVDSAMAHLAGALGKPVWLLLPTVADWRWGQGGHLTPWYSSMKIFRQGLNEMWSDVLRRVADELNDLVVKRIESIHAI